MLNLPPPPRYFPPQKGVYEVAPGLSALGKDFGNGEQDKKFLALDSDFGIYRENKIRCRKENFSKYVCKKDFPLATEQAVCAWLIERLCADYPDLFSVRVSRTDKYLFVLSCASTQEEITFDQSYNLVSTNSKIDPPYADLFDALCSNFPADLSVVTKNESKNWVSALHLCAPSHWAAADKIGRDFTEVHLPVPGIEKVNKAAGSLVDAMILRGPYIRFAWSMVTDRRLNHHPLPPPNISSEEWNGRIFDPAKASPFYLRVERQTLWGLPQVQSALFGIHVLFVDGAEIKANPEKNTLLKSALQSMTPESRKYKGVAHYFDGLISWLEA